MVQAMSFMSLTPMFAITRAESVEPIAGIERHSERSSDKENAMKPYQPSTPRAAFAVAAVALSAITFSLAVVVPATMDAGGRRAAAVVARVSSPAAIEKPVPAP